jgi:outer membrane protein
MKMTLPKTLCLVAVLATTAVSASAQTKTATINLQKVFDGYWKTKQADLQLHDQAVEVEKQRKEMIDGYEKVAKDYKKLLDDANDQAVSADERDKRKKAAESKFREMQDIETSVRQFENSSTTRLGEQKRRMREKILGEVTKVIKADASQSGYTLVIDTAAQSKDFTPIVVYSAIGTDDLTDKVLVELNANAPSDLPKAADDKGATDEKKDEKKSGNK